MHTLSAISAHNISAMKESCDISIDSHMNIITDAVKYFNSHMTMVNV